MTVEVIRADALADVPHGFLGRRGGVSTGIHAGLNVGLGSDDDRDAIHENRRRAVEAVKPGARLATVHQVHSAIAVVADAFPDDTRPHADALVTDRPDMLLGVLAADCVPVLFADIEAGVVGAAHSGWKGAIGGVSLATIEAMETLGADRSRIAAAVGPCIGRASYEVDDGFLARFVAQDPENERFFLAGRSGHHQFDIEAYVVARLAAAGVRRIEALGLDTYPAEDRFFSYRRATHRGEPGYGRQISLIGLPTS
ncbi:peptidoglycan editing factor PgeF [Sphingomonas sp. CGMCC 1.13654]|uniref:Purine nucleoside phosphorylase n=1 Tax=Sphingomonas chungangi TaxID=2683589 RepID=A0A838L843_9SPHN|nr:peptidoglycan editing factor PgeF [Sphingomonas chungangi]MBA2934892.1 peptidoglycan editing factor PgeF [Sphingomonas chungangi]MVW58203.1 peptidoglycan editing factor PgeF [Sphingomonas chungangi]